MKRLVAVIGLVLAFGATSSVKAAWSIESVAEYCDIFDWHRLDSPHGGDHEGNYWEISVAEHHLHSHSIYFGNETHYYEDVVIDAEGNASYTRTYVPHTGPPSVDTNSFQYTTAQRSYTCSIPNSYQSTEVSCKFRVTNVVYDPANEPENESTGTMVVTMRITGLTMPTTCTPINNVWVDVDKNIGYVKNGSVISSAPSGFNYEITGWTVGKKMIIP